MIVSEQARAAFIHLPKTGGTSVTHLLDEIWPDATTVGAKHSAVGSPAFEAIDASFLTFAFVRNPWDRLVSWYAMLTARARKSDAIRSDRFRTLVEFVDRSCPDFERFVASLTDPPDDAPTSLVSLVANSQENALTTSDGSMPVDVIGRFETLERDLALILRHNPYRDAPAQPTLAHRNRSERSDYRSYYTGRSRRLADALVAGDAARFDYRF